MCEEIENNELYFKTYPSLTKKLDAFSENKDGFSQELINDIVLWKVGKYVDISGENEKTALEKALENFRVKKCEDSYYTDNENNYYTDNKAKIVEVVKGIMGIKGCGRIAMTSTILKFINPKLFQIIDQRMMRVLYAENGNTNNDIYEYVKTIEKYKDLKNNDRVVEFYIDYLIKLRGICEKYGVANKFSDADRILFILDKDKKFNGNKMSTFPKFFYHNKDSNEFEKEFKNATLKS